MESNWSKEAIFYHIYPLGLCGAPEENNMDLPRVQRLEYLYPWLDHIQALGANAIYLGPVFRSSSHGYDTVDYFQVDRRLGNNDTLACFSEEVHRRGMRLVLDAVFNHVGREFWAFKDVLAKNEKSNYWQWFNNLKFDGRSPKGDPFTYEGWNGHYDLVKLNLSNPDVRTHLFDAVHLWIDQFGIDGLRLDAADSIDLDFLQALRQFSKTKRQDFWLMGEIVHGDYRKWANSETLESVTNYECYKALYSSLVEGNYFEVAYALNRQFGSEGLYRGLWLYNFVDNHDVDRVASKLTNAALLYPLYLLLFTMPGIPSLYYGSEWGIKGAKGKWSDASLRPAIELEKIKQAAPNPDLAGSISQLSQIKQNSEALRYGDYHEIFVDKKQFAFLRQTAREQCLVLLNSDSEVQRMTLDLPWQKGVLKDQLSQDSFKIHEGKVELMLSPYWGRILVISNE